MTTHKEDAHQLEADGIAELFIINLLNGGEIALRAGPTVLWQNTNFESIAIKIDGIGQNAEEEASRPTLKIANPEAMFSTMIRDGALDGAFVTRYKVLHSDLEADNNQYRSQTWRVRRVQSLTRNNVTLELRDQMDGQFFKTPARMFIPPEFRQVTLA